MRLLPKNFKLPKRTKLEAITFRGFGGGWNAVHDDLSMDARFLVEAKNVVRTASGAWAIRFGSRYFSDVSDVATGTRIIDQEYFNGRIISVTDTGQIVATDEDGVNELIWSHAIAAALPGAPTGWGSAFEVCDFVPFRDQLIIHNGVDKPVTIDDEFDVTYLQDLATGSNVNVPIGKYGCVVSNYHCIAGISGSPTTIYISSKGTAGVFTGDPAPNDGISIDVGAYAPQGAVEIRGIAGFRTNLIVFFQAQALVVTLGVYDDSATPVHTPAFPDSMPQFGLLGHRCVTQLANDLQFVDLFGMCSAKRNLFSGLYDSKHLSEYIEPRYRMDVSALDEDEQLNETFVLHDPLNKLSLAFLPGGTVFVYAANEELRYRGWSRWEDMNFTCGCTSFLGRIFVSDGMKIFKMGNPVHENEKFYGDRELDRDYEEWISGTLYTAGEIVYDEDAEKSYIALITHASSSAPDFATERSNHPTRWEEYLGNEIDFDVEMPWIDGKDPMKTKQLHYGKIASKGTSEFTLKIYVDNLYKDADGEEIYDPVLTMDFIGNDAPGFTADAGPMGGGRPSNDPRLYKLPASFKTIKFRFTGSTTKPLTVANASFLFTKGKFKR